MIKKLIETAFTYKDKAYTPYSGYHVGAAVLADNNKIYGGTNIEIASYSPTICAERTAIFKAVSEGARKIDKLVVTGDSEWTYPCGVCRQVMAEFAENNFELIVAKNPDEYKIYTLQEILPHYFGPKDVKHV